ncbi:hypothetical protein DL96DRAFT_708850 [Flagelloscypha sp. PMI_526]|nr:hypothetical protein DL96DRAFT_708850 [Flagelloscypha sp. PMI_526]
MLRVSFPNEVFNMPSHRSSRRLSHYKVSDDILVAILERCDPHTVVNTAKAFSRIRNLVAATLSLVYKCDLPGAGMLDGMVPYSVVPLRTRQGLLHSYTQDWPQLNWKNEIRLKVPNPARVGVCGPFFHQVRPAGNHATTVELSEFPSHRLGVSPNQTRRCRFDVENMVDYLTLDESLGLLVIGRVFMYHDEPVLELQFKDFNTFKDYKNACTSRYQTRLGGVIRHMSILLCGTKLAVTLDYAQGGTRHLLFNWKNSQVKWFDDHDVYFLNTDWLLGTRDLHNKPRVVLYNIAKVDHPVLVVEYELPRTLIGTSVKFAVNSAPRMDSAPNPRSLFRQDPTRRVILLQSRPIAGGPPAAPQWIIVRETFFRPPMGPKDATKVSWNHWSQQCVIRTQPSTLNGPPCVIGNRILYICHDTVPHGEILSRLTVVDFPLLSDPAAAHHLSKSWTYLGPGSGLFPSEVPKVFREESLVEAVFGTEDNIILVHKAIHNYRPIKVLTFGD